MAALDLFVSYKVDSGTKYYITDACTDAEAKQSAFFYLKKLVVTQVV